MPTMSLVNASWPIRFSHRRSQRRNFPQTAEMTGGCHTKGSDRFWPSFMVRSGDSFSVTLICFHIHRPDNLAQNMGSIWMNSEYDLV